MKPRPRYKGSSRFRTIWMSTTAFLLVYLSLKNWRRLETSSKSKNLVQLKPDIFNIHLRHHLLTLETYQGRHFFPYQRNERVGWLCVWSIYCSKTSSHDCSNLIMLCQITKEQRLSSFMMIFHPWKWPPTFSVQRLGEFIFYTSETSFGNSQRDLTPTCKVPVGPSEANGVISR